MNHDEQNSQGDTFEKAAASYINSDAAKRLQAPRKTWFFQRGDGMIFPCEEKEAWDICNNRSEWKRRDFKLLGTSDGSMYNKIVKESIADAKILEPEIEAMKLDLKKYERAEEKLLVDEAVDMEDTEDPANVANIAKVKRLRKIIDGLQKRIVEKQEEYRKATGGVVKRATDAELKVAKANMKKNGADWPQAANIETPGANERERRKILRAMNQAD